MPLKCVNCGMTHVAKYRCLANLQSRIAALESSLQELYDYSPQGMVNPSDDVVYQEVKRKAKALLGEASENGGGGR